MHIIFHSCQGNILFKLLLIFTHMEGNIEVLYLNHGLWRAARIIYTAFKFFEKSGEWI
jgi:hypothetical protein